MNYDNNNKISIFKNDKKGNEKAPDYRGTTTLNNQEYKVALWVRTSASGTKYMSGTVEIDTYKKQENERTDLGKAIDKQYEDKAYIDFGNSVELTDDDIAF